MSPQEKQKKPFFSFLRPARLGVALVIMMSVLVGYNGTLSYQRYCAAQPLPYVPVTPVAGVFCMCVKGPGQPCVPTNTASRHHTQLANSLDRLLRTASRNLETFMSQIINNMVVAVLRRLNDIELELIEWWKAMWSYGLLPDMQKQTIQLNTANTDQAKTLMGAIDAVEQTRTAATYAKQEIQDHRAHRPAEQTCVAATQSGGLGRAAQFSKAVRKGIQNKHTHRGLAHAGIAGAGGAAEVSAERVLNYEDTFCDPASNSGINNCASGVDPRYYDADIEVTRRIYNALTINVDDAPTEQLMVETLIDNMVGVVAVEPIQLEVMRSAQGIQNWLERRSYVARMNAVRSVPQVMVGWRMPGSMMGQWVTELRNSSGIPMGDISDNPSYREIVHAVAIDRLNSGKYANEMITDKTAVDTEKLVLSAFYLMQLRDYFELLERQALMLAVQVAVLTEREEVLNVSFVRPN